jgi:hypothetical protein
MKSSHPALIEALKDAAKQLGEGANYEWGHMARCNCGHLIQSLTGLDEFSVSKAVDHTLDEWTEHAKTYCPDSGRTVDEVFELLEKVGFCRQDVIHLENLSDPRVLKHIGNNVHLRRNKRDDLMRYLLALAEVLEQGNSQRRVQDEMSAVDFSLPPSKAGTAESSFLRGREAELWVRRSFRERLETLSRK